jgi:hypothetical protein
LIGNTVKEIFSVPIPFNPGRDFCRIFHPNEKISKLFFAVDANLFAVIDLSE